MRKMYVSRNKKRGINIVTPRSQFKLQVQTLKHNSNIMTLTNKNK